MIRRASGAFSQFIDVHHAKIDGVIAKYSGAAIFDDNIDSRHVVFLLFLGIEFEIILQTLNTRRKTDPIMSGRIKVFYTKVAAFSRNEQRGPCKPSLQQALVESARVAYPKRRKIAPRLPARAHGVTTFPEHVQLPSQ